MAADASPGGAPLPPGELSTAHRSALAAALSAFPPVAHAFAYGSSVFAQPGAAAVRAAAETPMVDYIFAARGAILRGRLRG